MIHFIGIGAQRSGTSWVYACLYEHPGICAPIKEIHFFSRERFKEGASWYESHFKNCDQNKVCGEFSTSYLYSPITASRIKDLYPHVKIIAILRNPISRAFSQYGNAIKGGEIKETVPFEEYYSSEKSVLEQGLYMQQLKEYLKYFSREQMHICIYEDNKKDPKKFIQDMYRFLNVDSTFVPSMLYDEINISRVPTWVGLEKSMHRFSEFLRRSGFDKLVHRIRRSGLPDMVRMLNTKKKREEKPVFDRDALVRFFREDVAELSKFLGRDLSREWNIPA